MLNVIVAIDNNYGIGKDNRLPWNIPEEMNVFKRKTQNCLLLCGKKTLETLPKKYYQRTICISRLNSENEIKEATKFGKEVFIIGGSQIYDYIFKNYKEQIKLHISIINKQYECDTYFNRNNLKDFYIIKVEKYNEFTHYEMEYRKYGESQYLNLLNDVLTNGDFRKTRNANTISDFGKSLKFDLRQGFPLLTTKKMFLKGIIEELLFFIRGDTNSKLLEEKGVNIWKTNTNREFLDSLGFTERKEGIMGEMYGNLWRNFGGIYNEETGKSESGIDQLQNVIDLITKDPTSRRIMMTTYNPEITSGVLAPCHSIILQFYVSNEFLDMFCYIRSNDLFLGSPFNIASSSILLILIAKITNLIPRFLHISIGDAHIYEDHILQVKEQLRRIPLIFPNIEIPNIETLKDIEKLTFEDFNLINYNFYPSIKATCF